MSTLKSMLTSIPQIPMMRIVVSLFLFADKTTNAAIAVIATVRMGDIPNNSENEKTILSTSTRIYERKNINQISANVGSNTGRCIVRYTRKKTASLRLTVLQWTSP